MVFLFTLQTVGASISEGSAGNFTQLTSLNLVSVLHNGMPSLFDTGRKIKSTKPLT